jgi:trk system potassium uptake protein TrkA
LRIVIAGCGRVGSDLARTLAEEGHDVSVIDNRPGVFRRLGNTFNGTTHRGIAYDVRVLREAGIEFADAFVAVTNSDNANVMSVQMAKQVFGVPSVLARLDDPAREDAYRALEVPFVPGAGLVSNVIREMVLDDEFGYHLRFSHGNVEIVEVVLGAAAEGLAVEQLEIDNGFRVAAVVRDRRTIIPRDGFALRSDDLVVGALRDGMRGKIRKYAAHREDE